MEVFTIVDNGYYFNGFKYSPSTHKMTPDWSQERMCIFYSQESAEEAISQINNKKAKVVPVKIG